MHAGAFEGATGTITRGMSPAGRARDGTIVPSRAQYTFKLTLSPTEGSSNSAQTEAAATAG
jgi:hypothetical protein